MFILQMRGQDGRRSPGNDCKCMASPSSSGPARRFVAAS